MKASRRDGWRHAIVAMLTVTLALALSAVPDYFSPGDESRYLGKTLGEWLEEAEHHSPQATEDAIIAIKHLGSTCIPTLFQMLTTTDMRFMRKMRDIAEGSFLAPAIRQVPCLRRAVISTPCTKHRQAVFAFQALGKLPIPATVELARIISDERQDRDIRLHALGILLELEQVPSEARLVLKATARAIWFEVNRTAVALSRKDTTALTRTWRQESLTLSHRAPMGKSEAAAVDKLTAHDIDTTSYLCNAVQHNNANVRAAACLALAAATPNDEVTVHALMFGLHDPDFLVALSALKGFLLCDNTGASCVRALCDAFGREPGALQVPGTIRIILENCYPELLAPLSKAGCE